MTTQETPVEANAETTEVPVESKKSLLKRLPKKALLWGTAALGLIAIGAVALVSNANSGALEDDSVDIEEIPGGFTVTDATPEITD